MDSIPRDQALGIVENLKSAGDLRQKKILVTGGAGFLGSWLCATLTLIGAEVLCLDNLETGLIRNISRLKSRDNFSFIRADVSEYSSTRPRPDLILHLASRASPDSFIAKPVETIRTNTLGTMRMLELARRTGAVMVYASSSEVYGDADRFPTPESYWGRVNPVGMRSCYDEGKRAGEAMCISYERQYSLDTRILRIFNTYGPGLRADGIYGRAISRFITQALSGRDLTVYGDGSQTRSFCYITDTTSGMLRASSMKSARGGIYNLGNPEEIKIADLARLIIGLAESTSKIAFHALPEDDPRRRVPDITRIREELEWNPKVPLSDGLRRTVEWFRRQGSGNRRSPLSR